MDFIVKPFVLYDAESHCYCYTHESSAKLVNQQLIDLMRSLHDKRVSELDKSTFDELAAQFKLEPNAVLRFLTQELQILTFRDQERFQHLHIISDNRVVREALASEFSAHYGLKVSESQTVSTLDTKRTLVLLFQQQYNEADFKELYSSSSEADSYYISSYLADKYLIIDNIYNREKGMPCHFCGVNQLRTTTLTSPDINNFSWLVFYRRLLQQGTNTFPTLPLTPLTESLVIYTLGRFIKQFIDPFNRALFYDNATEFWHVDLSKNSLEREAAVHWPLCECMQA